MPEASVPAAFERWERPAPPIGRRDIGLSVVVGILAIVLLELVRRLGALETVGADPWVQRAATLAVAALLVARRRHPLVVAGLAAAHMFVVGVTMPLVMAQMSLQVVYFVAFFSATAWARDRAAAAIVCTGIVLVMALWIAWNFAYGSGVEDIVDANQGAPTGGGVATAAILITVIINVLYFGGAIQLGRVTWRAARARAVLAHQAETIADQSSRLRTQAVVDERLRIARELHDVVGHHIAGVGLHAGAARRLVGTDPVAAAEAMATVESSATDAVAQLRGLLGALRMPDGDGDTGRVDETGRTNVTSDTNEGQLDPGKQPDRSPGPALADLPALLDQVRDRLDVELTTASEPPGALEDVPPAVGAALYRVVQESLTNVRRHSTADSARVALRCVRHGSSPHVEVEVTDSGRPRNGTSGSGLGQLGIRERVAGLGGTVDIGPRVTGGYRVRVRIPLAGSRS